MQRLQKAIHVTVGTIFEDSHIPLHKWLLAIHLLTSSKKGMSAHQLMRNLDIKQYKSARFMVYRIRYAMTGELPEPMGGVVEAQETYVEGRFTYKLHTRPKREQRQKDMRKVLCHYKHNRRLLLDLSAAEPLKSLDAATIEGMKAESLIYLCQCFTLTRNWQESRLRI